MTELAKCFRHGCRQNKDQWVAGRDDSFFVFCNSCFACGPTFKTREIAAEEHNRIASRLADWARMKARLESAEKIDYQQRFDDFCEGAECHHTEDDRVLLCRECLEGEACKPVNEFDKRLVAEEKARLAAGEKARLAAGEKAAKKETPDD